MSQGTWSDDWSRMKDSLFPLAIRLLENGIYFRYLRHTGKPGPVKALSIEVTHRCMAKCVMCNIWRIPGEVPDLSIEEWIGLLSSKLLSHVVELDITGGEPFLRSDLVKLFSGICELKASNLSCLQSVALTTNGFLTRRVSAHTEEILQLLRKQHVQLVVVCAMDGVGRVHDTVRNVRNAWIKVNETVQKLRALREKYSNLILGLKTTIVPINVGELDQIVRYAHSNGLFTIVSPRIITRGRYLNPNLEASLSFKEEDIRRIIGFYERDVSGWSYHGQQLAHFYKTGEMHKACSCGFNYLFVRSNGDLFLCPLIGKSVGNIRETPVTDLFLSKESTRLRQNVGTYAECKQCTEPGLERYSLPFEGFAYLALLRKMGRRRFLRYHHEMGLDKHFMEEQKR
jgi:MoaA/NifB/PqqE/SkfB family radical SAM enzyme